MLPPRAESKAVQVWLRREKGRREEGAERGEEVERRRRRRWGGRYRAALLITAQQLHSQGDALVPLPWQNANVSGVERRLKDVLFVNVVVTILKQKSLPFVNRGSGSFRKKDFSKLLMTLRSRHFCREVNPYS